MRNPSGAEGTGSEDVGVAVLVARGVVVTEGMGNIVEVELTAVRAGAFVGMEVTPPQAPTSNAMRVMENTTNAHFDVFINNIIANSKG